MVQGDFVYWISWDKRWRDLAIVFHLDTRCVYDFVRWEFNLKIDAIQQMAQSVYGLESTMSSARCIDLVLSLNLKAFNSKLIMQNRSRSAQLDCVRQLLMLYAYQFDSYVYCYGCYWKWTQFNRRKIVHKNWAKKCPKQSKTPI